MHHHSPIPKYQFIKNILAPLCKDCSYFKSQSNAQLKNLQYCNKFGVKNPVSGEIKYASAEACRKNARQCGLSGKYYKKKEFQYFV